MFTPSICWVVMGADALVFVFMIVEFSARFFTLLIHPHQDALYFLFPFFFCLTICISEVVDVSPNNLDDILWFIHLVFWEYTLLMLWTGLSLSFPSYELINCSMSGSNSCILTHLRVVSTFTTSRIFHVPHALPFFSVFSVWTPVILTMEQFFSIYFY